MINITIVTHSGLFVIHIASFVLKIPYLIPAICHQQLIRGWLIIQPSHAWLQPVSVNCRGGRKKASVSGWSVVSVDNPTPETPGKQCRPKTPPSSPPVPLASHPGCPGRTLRAVRWDGGPVLFLRPGSVIPYSAFPCVIRHPRDERDAAGWRGPVSAPPRNFYREKPGVVRDGGGRTVHFCSCPHGDGLS